MDLAHSNRYWLRYSLQIYGVANNPQYYAAVQLVECLSFAAGLFAVGAYEVDCEFQQMILMEKSLELLDACRRVDMRTGLVRGESN